MWAISSGIIPLGSWAVRRGDPRYTGESTFRPATRGCFDAVQSFRPVLPGICWAPPAEAPASPARYGRDRRQNPVVNRGSRMADRLGFKITKIMGERHS